MFQTGDSDFMRRLAAAFALAIAVSGCAGAPTESARPATPTTAAPLTFGSVAMITQCLDQHQVRLASNQPVHPIHTAEEVIAALKADHETVTTPATARMLTLSTRGDLPLSITPGASYWVEVESAGTNRISELMLGPPRTSPLDGRPVYLYRLVPDSTLATATAGFCAIGNRP